MVEQRLHFRGRAVNEHLRRARIIHEARARPAIIDTNENMALLGGNLDGSDKEEVAEEDYDPKSFEEMKERAEPQFYDASEIPELTVKLSNPTKASKPSKLFADAINAMLLEPGMDEAEVDDTALMSPEDEEKSYGYGHVGVRMQKRIPLKQPYEQMLQGHMVKLKSRIEKKVKKYTRNGN